MLSTPPLGATPRGVTPRLVGRAGPPTLSCYGAYDGMPARQAWRLLARGVLALAGLLDKTGGELAHLISDAATMQIIRWTLTLNPNPHPHPHPHPNRDPNPNPSPNLNPNPKP